MSRLLADTLLRIEKHDTDYGVRYGLVLQAMYEAWRIGLEAGFDYDDDPTKGPEFDGRRIVAYIELPTGQCSWHLPQHGHLHGLTWDGHTTEEKHYRIRAYAEQVRRG